MLAGHSPAPRLNRRHSLRWRALSIKLAAHEACLCSLGIADLHENELAVAIAIQLERKRYGASPRTEALIDSQRQD